MPVFNVDGVAAGLAESTADAFVVEDDGSEITRAANWLPLIIDLGVNLHEFDRVVTSGLAFIDTQLAGFFICQR